MQSEVILVDINDKKIGNMEKIQAHKLGKLHQAFSIFIYNDKNELLLQKRSSQKYHSGGLWTNTCCSHPQPSDKRSIEEIAKERLVYEMGIYCNLKKVTTISYNLDVGNGLREHEFNTILIGFSNETPIPNSFEVSDFQWKKKSEIELNIDKYPNNYTVWFQEIIKKKRIIVDSEKLR